MKLHPSGWGVPLLAVALLTITPVLPALAQAQPAATAATTAVAEPAAPAGFWLTTPYPELQLPVGQKASIPLTLRNDGLPPQRVALSVSGLPAGWSATLTGAGKPVTAAMVGPNETQTLSLDLVPPADVKAGDIAATVTASYGTQTATLPLTLRLAAQAAGTVTLKPQLPALRGSPGSTFEFRVDVANNSPNDALFNLGAQLPAGFTATFKRGYDAAEITGVPIAAGKTETVSLSVKPGADTPAGDYPFKFAVLAGDLSAAVDLGMQITGTPGLALAGPEQRLSGEATAGQATTFPFTLTSTGSSPAQNVKLTASAPTGWKVEFSPAEIPALDPGQSADVAVSITPSEKAVAGDYMVGLRAGGDGANGTASFRTTVNTSTQWGIVGLAVIAAALIVLVVAIMRYGRR